MDGPEQAGPSFIPPRKMLAPNTAKLMPKDGLGKKSVPSGSATGNPRNKTALAPGHSLMDWIRLGTSGKDLTGVGGKPRPVDRTELAKHCTQDDAWLAIRGKVFNVTNYLDFHPGGRDELMRGAGRDATALFDAAHAWVNYESLLQKCFVGPLTSAVTEQEQQELSELFTSVGGKNKIDRSPFAIPNNIKSTSPFATPKIPQLKNPSTNSSKDIESPTNTAEDMSEAAGQTDTSEETKPMSKCLIAKMAAAEALKRNTPEYAIAENNNQKQEEPPAPEKPPVRGPRFDWMQITSRITYIFYTRPCANPHVRVAKSSEESDTLEVVLGYDRTYFKFTLTPLYPLQFPCTICITQHTGKVELKFQKERRCVWGNFGILVKHPRADKDDKERAYFTTHLSDCGRNTVIMSLNGKVPEVSTYPVGSFFMLTVEGMDKKRCYTPISRYFDSDDAPPIRTLTILIKTYPAGFLTPHLVKSGVNVRIFAPISPFDLSISELHSRYLLISGGTGIAPFLDLILYLLKRKNNITLNILFIIYDRSEEDMLCREKLQQLASEHSCQFTVLRVLTKPSESWTGPTGRINECKLKDMLSRRERPTQILICGPPKFMEAAVKALKKLKFQQSEIITFG